METVSLKNGRERSLLRHHPWIYSGALEPFQHEIQAGETVRVADVHGETLGYGSFSTASQIRVRMLSFNPEEVPCEDFISRRVAGAVELRKKDGALFSSCCRLVNAENDGLPGMVADFYASWVVCQFTTAGAEHWKEAFAKAMMEHVPGCLGVSSRRDADARMREHLTVAPGLEILAGAEPPPEITVEENGLKFAIDPRKGHKTGFYIDQREAREAVGRFARGRRVLNCFSYTGGFGIYAAANGAISVEQVDASADALELARRNAELNALGTPMEYSCRDVFQYLRKLRDMGRTFDMIVLDPPKFAEGKSQIMKAARGYKDINLLAMKLLSPGGILATFSCSGAVSPEFFDQILAEAAADARRDFRIIARTGHCIDHPVALSFPEGRYLKGVILKAF